MRIARYLFLLLPAALGCENSVMPGTTRTADGVRLYYRSVGSGRDTVLVLHDGPGLHGEYLVEALAPLGSSATFLIYDLRGRGRSSPELDTSALSMAQDVADVEAMREAHGLERVTLIGHGWGAGVAAGYAVAQPERVSRMLFISPMFPRDSHGWGILMFPYSSADSLGLGALDSVRLAGLDRSDPAAFCRRYWGAWLSPAAVRDVRTLRRLARPMCDAPAEALARVEAVNRSMKRSLGSWDWRTRFVAVQAPVLLIQGAARVPERVPTGSVVWRTAAREWTEAFSNSGVVFLEAHPLFPWLDDPGGFHRAAATFLRGNWPNRVVASRGR